ncbi:gamma-glutamyltranspeptidase [Mycobacterium dioxanotrophicus]|uniref:Gamma-glutamyltranspeptidase n=1 Tax=Mycobacterium dioxanotrophicus TaxID=482462 RepID=A0A1Y0CAL0_9MYCO|nr:gamma-glutamyltransferase [Mycobacterium dioxanotrophicus]ART72290.1 gamma-glutamyltranspeptidase [Mycobacterium dioxanotrophicus]
MPVTSTPQSFTGAIATPHVLATEAATEVYRDGGGAVDAAIAAAAVLTVVYPHNVALGGDLIALVRTPDGSATCVNASGWAGAAADPAAMRIKHGARLPVRGADTITVPGGVRGWETLRSFGSRLPWDRLLAPAEEAARAGVPVAGSLAANLADPENGDLIGMEDFERVFRPGGRVPAVGEDFRQPALADTFAALRDGGAAELYTGGLAAQMVHFLRQRGSALDADDFAEFQPEVTEPLSVTFRGLTVLSSPPNSHGFLMLRALRAIDELDLDAPVTTNIGCLMRVFHHGNRLRSSRLADPRLVPVDFAALLNDDLSADAPEVDTAGAAHSVPRGDTVGIAAADSDGVAVSLIQSVFHAFGSGVVDPRTGILFHDRGTSFSLDAGSPNVLAPRKRPVHTLMPVLTTENGSVRHILATMGGQGQPQILTQVLLRMLAGATPVAAVAAPRAIVGSQGYGSTADSVLVEADIDAVAATSVAMSGLTVVEVPPHSEELGQANVVEIDRRRQFTAASDPRADGAAAVVQYPRRRQPSDMQG